MASIKFFRNETKLEPITAEPVFWVTPKERREQLWEIAREQILGDCSVPGEAPPPSGGACNAATQDEVADKISAQDEASTHLRRKTRQKKVEDDQTGDDALKAGAEQKIVRLGARERVPVDPSNNIAATMIAATQGFEENRHRVTGKSSTKHGKSRGLLYPGELLQQRDQPGKLGPSKRVVLRAQGEHNVGSRVIA